MPVLRNVRRYRQRSVKGEASHGSASCKTIRQNPEYQGSILKIYEDTVDANGHLAHWDFHSSYWGSIRGPVTKDGTISYGQTVP